MIRILSPQPDERISMLTPEQDDFIRAEELRASCPGGLSNTSVFDYYGITGDCTFPKAVRFSWEGGKSPFRLEIFCRNDKIRSLSVTGYFVYVYNLPYDRELCWKITDADGEYSPLSAFSLFGKVRFLFVDGITNVRDIASFSPPGGRKIRDGMVYRGSEMNMHVHITKAGIARMQEELKIKTDLDLRGEALTDPEAKLNILAEAGCEHIICPQSAYEEIFDEKYRGGIHSFFELLTHEELYPVYIHCFGGADRTGTLILLLEALLGVTLDTLYLDYELTTLTIWDIRTRNFHRFRLFMDKLLAHAPDTDDMTEKARNFLADYFDVPSEWIDKIRQILLA